MKSDELYKRLVDKIRTYHPYMQLDKIEQAYRLAHKAHLGQFRKSSEEYIVHPLEVALILADFNSDTETIMAALLHDVVEDTSYTIENLRELFGGEVALLVDGVTKLKKNYYTKSEEHSTEGLTGKERKSLEKKNKRKRKSDEKAENYRKMIMTMAKDIRILLIKLADRLHNMRTLEFHYPEKQREIALETLEIYSPLAHRLGISRMRYDLEDLAFKYWKPDKYRELKSEIQQKLEERRDLIRVIEEEIREHLKVFDFGFKVEGRPKHFFSIYKKMMTKGKTLNQIHDLFALRVLVDDFFPDTIAEEIAYLESLVHLTPDQTKLLRKKKLDFMWLEGKFCYEAMGILHAAYNLIPGRFKDYIAAPKPNGYRSLHTGLIREGKQFEVQVRTLKMHKVAEEGIAAHWIYKSEGSGGKSREEQKLTWLGEILERQREIDDNDEFMEALKFDLGAFSENIYCLTPKGDSIGLREGSTIIDFAYSVHSAVGNMMVHAKANGEIVPLSHVLKSGDIVEIITSHSANGPTLDWLKIATTNRAKSKINTWFRKQNKEEDIKRGKDLLTAEAELKDVKLEALMGDSRLEKLLLRYSLKDVESLYASVGHGNLRESSIVAKLFAEYKKATQTTEDILNELLAAGKKDIKAARNSKTGIYIEGLGDPTFVKFAGCCCPIPGDDIVGFVTRAKGLSIHRIDCINVINLDAMGRERLQEAIWVNPDKSFGLAYNLNLQINCRNHKNLVSNVARIVSEQGLTLKGFNAKFGIGGVDGVIELNVEINNRKQYKYLYSKIIAQAGVYEIDRVTT